MYLTRNDALKLEPELGPEVIGVTYCPKDASVNPKRLVRVLKQMAEKRGVRVELGQSIEDIKYDSTTEIYTLNNQFKAK